MPVPFPEFGDDRILNACEQGGWLLGNAEQAEYAVGRAVAEVHVSSMDQEENWKRSLRYKAEQRRPKYRAYLDRNQLFDLLVLQYLLVEEKHQEANGFQLTAADRIKRFTKQIVAVSLSHNSYWAAIGLCRIICNYEPREIDRLYTVVAPNRAFIKAGSEPSNRVRVGILNIVADRFNVEQEQIVSEDTLAPADWRVQLVKETLERFLPSHKPLIVPERYQWDPRKPPLVAYDENTPWGDNQVEVDRICLFLKVTNFNQIAKAEEVKPFEESVRNLSFWR